MARHEITIHENTGATKLTAPYLGTYQSKGTVKITDLYGDMAQLSGLPEIQIRTIIEGGFDEIVKLQQIQLVRLNTDLGQFCGKISGSFPSADAEFNTSRNKMELVLHLADDIKADLVSVTPTIVTEETVTRVKIGNVMDKAVNKPLNLIHGTNTFRVAGYNLVMDDEGAECYLLDSAGVKYPCVVDTQISDQLFEAHVSGLSPAGGDYRFFVKSRGGDVSGPLQTDYRLVKVLYIAPVPPYLTEVHSDGQSAGVVKVNDQIHIMGVDLAAYDPDSDTITFHFKEAGAWRTFDGTILIQAAGDTEIQPANRFTTSCDDGSSAYVIVTIGDKTLRSDFTLSNPPTAK